MALVLPPATVPVHHIKTALPLIQPHFEVGRGGWAGEIDCAIFDIEDTVGRGAFYRSENTAVPAGEGRAARVRIGAQIIPIREDEVGAAACVRQAAVCEDQEGFTNCSVPLESTFADSVGLVVYRIREWQRDGGRAVVV